MNRRASENLDFPHGSRVDDALARTFRRFCSMVGCGQVSGVLMRPVWPLPLMALRGSSPGR